MCTTFLKINTALILLNNFLGSKHGYMILKAIEVVSYVLVREI